MRLNIEMINEQTQHTINSETFQSIEKALEKASEVHDVSQAEVVLSFVDDSAIQYLNKQYRNVDRPTDVLSFAMNESGEDELKITGNTDLPNMLGDIVISVPRAVEQAKEFGHSFDREICFLAVHGFLHLLGYDHGTEEEEREMFSVQEEILQKVGVTR